MHGGFQVQGTKSHILFCFRLIPLWFLALPSLCLAAPTQVSDPMAVDKNLWAPASVSTKINQPLPSSVAKEPVAVANPGRPVEPPTMPAVSKTYSLQVDSTAEAAPSGVAQIGLNPQGEPDLVLQEQNWRDAADMARAQADEIKSINSDGERVPLNVRMSYLPNPKLVPQEKPQRAPRPRLTEVPSSAKNVALPHKSAAECDASAVDTYKKKQLEALESDRKTLEALQAAIADLGLQKQLNFMTNASQGSAANTSQPQSMNISVPVTATP